MEKTDVMANYSESQDPDTSISPISDGLRDVKPVLIGSTGTKNGSSFDTVLQQICQFLDKSEQEQPLDHEKLIVTFKYLQQCSLSSASVYLLDSRVLEIVARTYDKLIPGDFGKQEVLSSVLELLYLIEDMSESVEGKTQCGKYFIDRLLTLATTEVQSVNLHRAVVETLCAIITKSPANQKRVIDDRDACLKLFKQCLPSCGDFQLQASLTEVYYRLLKLDPKLLDLVTEKRVRGAMETLLQQQKPDLLAKIKEFVLLLNECMGPFRSVYTFLANKILLNGQNVTPSEEKLISFGKTHFSFYQTLCQDVNIDGPTILDVEYKDIIELNSGSRSILELVVQDGQNVLSTQSTSGNQHQQVRILVSMAPHDFSILETHVLPKLQTQSISTKTGLSGLGMRKSSIGIIIPQSKESTLAFQNKNEAEQYISGPLRGILKKSDVNVCTNPNIPDEVEIVGKENWSKNARKKENFSEEPAVVKATPQKVLASNFVTSPSMEVASTHLQSGGAGVGFSLDARKEVSKENSKDFDARVPLSRIVKRLNKFVDPKQGEFPTGQQKQDTGNDNHSEEEKSCNSELNEARVQACTTASGFRAKKGIVGRQNIRFTEKDKKPCALEDIKAIPQVEGFDSRVRYQQDTTAVRGNMKSTKDVMGGRVIMGYKTRTPTISHEMGKDGRPLLKLQIGRKPDDIYDFKNGPPESQEAKQTFETSGKKNTHRAEPSMPRKAHSDKKTAESPKNRSNQAARKYLTRRAKCKKPDSKSYNSRSDSEETVASKSDEEWAPGKENTDPIETESQEHKDGAAKGRRQRKGCIRQKTSNNTGKKGDLPIQVKRRKSIISEGTASPTSKVSAVQRKTAHADVYSFTSDEEERIQCKANITATREKSQGGKGFNRKGRATALSFASIQEQPGKVQLISRAFKDISQNKRHKVQTEDRREAGEPNDNDVLITSKPIYHQRVNKSSKTDKLQKQSRIERWKSSTYTDHTVPESTVGPEERIHVSPSDTSADELSPKTGADVNVPDNQPVSADDNLQEITTLIKGFKDRMKSETKRKMTDIVFHTSQLIEHGIERTQRLIQEDVADFVQTSKQKYGQLNSKLEGQTKRMRQVYEQFQKDFKEHIEQYEKIVEEIDETDRELTDVARKRGQEHKELFERLQETSMSNLADADQKILSATKASEAMYGLRRAVEGLMCLEY